MPTTDVAMLEERRESAPMQQRELLVQPDTWNAEARTVEVCFTTGARRASYSFERWEMVDEELSTEASAVRMERLNAGAPVLNAHARYELGDQIGVVVPGSARMEGGRGFATLQLSARESVADIVNDIAAGIIRSVSVGYLVHRYAVTEQDGQRPLYRAEDWEPFEISFVPVPADAGAQVRGDARQGGFPCIVSRTPAKERAMPDTIDTPAVTTPAPTPAVETRAAVTTNPVPGVTAGRLIAATRAAGLSQTASDEIIALHDANPLTERDLMAEIGTRFAQLDTQVNITPARVTEDQRDKTRAAVTSALLHRANPQRYKLENGGEHYRGMRMTEIGREMIVRSGQSASGLSAPDIASYMLNQRDGGSGFHTSSDFPNITGNVANRILRDAYEAAPRTFEGWTRETTLPDFKTASLLTFGDAPRLLEVLGADEFKRGTLGEGAENIRLRVFGRVVALTRQLIINDDIGAFTRMPEMWAAAVADFEGDQVYSLLLSNPVMSDGKTLFHADHGNLATTGTAISVTSLAAGRSAMQKQTGLDGARINAMATFLIVGPDKLLEAEQMVAGIIAATSGAVNPFAGKLQIVCDPRITGNQWFLSAGPGRAGTLVRAYLEGEARPRLDTRPGFDVDGVEYKCALDYGAAFEDWRGIYRNPGA